ncbi:DNA repair protein RecO [Ascidiimonas sp. W6]|uniref:DNA repair protein RecO n=1 Tax=Ascidiimonas meishanensis TaxID=3128903 RepID=UPI0030EB7470
MIVVTKAIVISVIKYGDSSLIVKCLTAAAGMKSYLLKGVRNAKKGKLKVGYFQPLTQLEIIANHKDKGTLDTIRDVKVSYPYQSLHIDVRKNAIAFFLAEVLSLSIYEEEDTQMMFRFIESALQWLDVHNEVSNFHIAFLLMLTRYLGFYPDDSHKELPFFDLEEGAFTANATSTAITDENLECFKSFLGIVFDDIPLIKLSRARRRELVKILITYFELHLQGFRKPKSMVVLNEVFN